MEWLFAIFAFVFIFNMTTATPMSKLVVQIIGLILILFAVFYPVVIHRVA